MDWLFESLYRSAAMLWQMLWALVLGFGISSFMQTFVSKQQMARAFGKNGLREVALATLFGAASSSCSYAAAATSKTVFKKGAALVPALTFLLASTNLVIEIGIVIWMLMGWRFVVAEIAGAIVMILVMALLVRWLVPKKLVEAGRKHAREQGEGQHHHHHGPDSSEGSLLEKIKQPAHWSGVPQSFMMDVSMLWKEIVIGVLIAGFLATLVPKAWWEALFISGDSGPLKMLENAVVGPLIAMASFVCSVGNIPFASLLWASGISFGGVIAFIYGDLIVLPLVLAYRKYYGWPMALSITGILFAAMVTAAMVVELLFSVGGLLPEGARPAAAISAAAFKWNYTTWLNCAALAVLGYFGYLHFKQKPQSHPKHQQHQHQPGHAH